METGLNFVPFGACLWVCLELRKFAVEQRFLVRVELCAPDQIIFLHLPNAFQDFTTIPAAQIGQLLQNLRFAHEASIMAGA